MKVCRLPVSVEIDAARTRDEPQHGLPAAQIKDNYR